MADPIHPGMASRISGDARSGAAKSPQMSFAQTWGMKDQTAMSGIAPGSTGPDAAPATPLGDPAPPSVHQKSFAASWGMTDADGDGVDNSMSGRVLGDAILSGSDVIPGSDSEVTASSTKARSPK